MIGTLGEIRNFIALDERIGTAGQPARDQFSTIAACGYETVVNLAMPDHPDAIGEEGALVTSLGMTYIHIPVPFDAPSERHLSQFLGIMETNRRSKLFVHCIMNYRVSAFMYHYFRRIEGRSDFDSRSPMFKKWQPDTVWLAFLSLGEK